MKLTKQFIVALLLVLSSSTFGNASKLSRKSERNTKFSTDPLRKEGKYEIYDCVKCKYDVGFYGKADKIPEEVKKRLKNGSTVDKIYIPNRLLADQTFKGTCKQMCEDHTGKFFKSCTGPVKFSFERKSKEDIWYKGKCEGFSV